MSGSPMILCENLVKIYKTAEIEVVALQGLDIAIGAGELMGIIGNSGSGKSTLLNIIGGLDRPSAGTVLVDGKDLLKLDDRQLVEYRRATVGFVWQNNARNLIPYLSAQENVEIPMLLNGARKRRERARELLDLVGLSRRAGGRLAELSGGEQQRVAIAIAMANRPRILLADEPTGEVDSATAMKLLEVFREASRGHGITVVIVTHDQRISRKVDRVVAIRDGRTSSEFVRRRSYAEELAEMGAQSLSDGDRREHEELAVVDRAGRLQVPREYLDALGVKGQIKVELDGNRIVLKPPGATGPA
jgi:ABC-type lipoprotein export system ATPase subunit